MGYRAKFDEKQQNLIRQVNNEEKCSLSVVRQCAKGGPPCANLFVPYRKRGLQYILCVVPVLFFFG